MTLITRQPFPSLCANNLLSQGSAGQVFAVTRHIVFKCPTLFEDAGLSPDNRVLMEQSAERLENEKQVYRLLNLHPHPHLLQGILCVREGIFMPRLDTTLTVRLSSETSPDLQERWRQTSRLILWSFPRCLVPKLVCRGNDGACRNPSRVSL